MLLSNDNNTPQSKYTIALVGATGNVGSELVLHILSTTSSSITTVSSFLARNKEIQLEIRIITRRPESIIQKTMTTKKISKLNIEIIKANYCDINQEKEVLCKAFADCHVVFIALPQALSSQEMISVGEYLGDCIHASANPELLPAIVRLSSFGIDKQSCKYVTSQGPLGDAHIAIETYYTRILQLPKVVSLRPTSFASNLMFQWEEIQTNHTMTTPLGIGPSVNWVAPCDIAQVTLQEILTALVDGIKPTKNNNSQQQQQLKVVDILGPENLTAPQVCQILSKVFQNQNQQQEKNYEIIYQPSPLPTLEFPDYLGLFKFLRAGGFDVDQKGNNDDDSTTKTNINDRGYQSTTTLETYITQNLIN